MSWEHRIQETLRRYNELTERLADPALLNAKDKFREVAREHSDLTALAEAAREMESVRSQLAEARQMMAGDDVEMAELAEAEVAALTEREQRLADDLKRLLVPKDPLADRAAVLEIRAGTGGDEAGLFAGDLFRMYSRFAETRRWSIEVLSISEGERGSIKEVVFTVRGKNAYGDLRNESGVHRVQRVPATETQGRIHTSAATVAVLPEAEEVDIDIKENDIRVDVYRSSGPGGQSVNTTDSAVRLTHIPTGLVVTCQDEKSQLKNKVKAMKVLRSRLLDAKIAAQEAERARERKTQVGTGDRSGKIRTYNYPQSRVTDHRIGYTSHNLPAVMNGDLEEIIDALKAAREAEHLESGATAGAA